MLAGVQAWDWGKYNVRLFFIQESKFWAKVRREEENTIQKHLQEAQINFQRHPSDETKKELLPNTDVNVL